MRQRRPFRCLLGPALLVCLAPGCLSLHSERPVKVLVRDAETKNPVPDAEVRLTYRSRPSDIPTPASEKTKTDGIALLTTTPNGKDALIVQASANGYSPESMVISSTKVEEIEPAGWFESVERRSVTYIVDVYSGPPFAVELTIPVGMHGLIKAELQIQDDANCAPKQRTFQYRVEPTGSVMIAGPAQLRRVNPATYIARYADGTPLGQRMDKTQIGFRWLKHEGNVEYFVVGTQAEYDNYHHQLFPDEPSSPAPSSSGRGGGGGGGRGGRGGGGGGGGGGGFGGGGRGGFGGGGYGGPGGFSQ